MTRPTVGHLNGVYELSFLGSLGPVLRAALSPDASIHVCTVVRSESPTEIDLADVMARLDAHDLHVEAIASCRGCMTH